jgi:hypothetical protein
MEDCKYRLPCNWCDKHDELCVMSMIGIEISECKHPEWKTERAEAVTKEEAGCVTYYTLRCSACGKTRIKRVEFDSECRHHVTIYEEA